MAEIEWDLFSTAIPYLTSSFETIPRYSCRAHCSLLVVGSTVSYFGGRLRSTRL